MPDDFADFITHLTTNARMSVQHADAIARGNGSSYIGTEHLLLGVLAQGSSTGAKMLADVGITLQQAEIALDIKPAKVVVSTGAVGLSETALLTLRMAWETAKEFNHDYLGTEHILHSVLRQGNARATTLLRNELGVDVEDVLEDLESYFDRNAREHGDVLTEPKRGTVRGGALATFVPTGLGTETALIACELYRRQGAWKVRAVGQGYASGLAGIARDFGLNV